jgi:hypothetical protein
MSVATKVPFAAVSSAIGLTPRLPLLAERGRRSFAAVSASVFSNCEVGYMRDTAVWHSFSLRNFPQKSLAGLKIYLYFAIQSAFKFSIYDKNLIYEYS